MIDWIARLNNFPEFMTSQHLVDLGLFSSTKTVWVARHNKSGPHFVRIIKKILYPKEFVIEWIKKNTVENGDE